MQTQSTKLNQQTVLMVGASGEVGKRVLGSLDRLTTPPLFHLLVRKPLKLPDAQHRTQHVVDFNNLDKNTLPPSLDTYICTLGTTIKQAGSQSRFEAIDLNLVLTMAETAFSLGAKKAIVISAIGANNQSSSFYLKTKGRMEESLKSIGYEEVHILRPSLLIGHRVEFRFGEALGGYLAPLINPLLLGPLAKYKAIEMNTVAGAIVKLTIQPPSQGTHIHTYKDIIKFAK